MSAEQNKASVSLTEGLIAVENDRSTVELTPGKQIMDITSTDNLSAKIEDIPYKLFVESDRYQLDFNKEKRATIRLSIQLGDVVSGNNIKRSAPLYLKSNYQNVRFPEDVTLNEEGFVRVPIEILAPTAEAALDGHITVWAVMDDNKSIDVGEGNILIKVKEGKKNRRFRIDAKSGKVIQGQ